MKIIFLIVLIYLFQNLFSKKIKRVKSKSKSKSLNRQYYYIPNTSQQVNVNPTSINPNPYYVVNPNNLYTPLTTGTFSSGGNIYQTNASAIPYGTGYSYGKWQKIPTF